MSNPIRLLIVDDHPVVRDGLRGMLSGQTDFEVLGEAADGLQAVALTAQLQPDVVLMDLRMPELDGAAAISRIHASHPLVRVLVLTTYDSDAEILRAIEAGATGYILKDAPRDELYRAIRATAQGQSYLSPAVATRLMGQLRAPAQEQLSPREIDVLGWVARGAGNKEIGQHLHISEATVKSHLLHIYEKLGASDRAHAVTLAVQKGLIKI
ncbi:MAG: DNA-binding response regulator [Chloroflexi bacterium HGW-Chloroflexi-10]|nr:MAG: DNA-binding response regulator [Chloroflexi bacterium HGW-Chloroflexi-10]